MNFEINKAFEEMAETICKLPTEQQNRFFQNLAKTCSPEEVRSLQIGVSLYSMYRNPAKYEAMKAAVAEMLVEEFKPTF